MPLPVFSPMSRPQGPPWHRLSHEPCQAYTVLLVVLAVPAGHCPPPPSSGTHHGAATRWLLPGFARTEQVIGQ